MTEAHPIQSLCAYRKVWLSQAILSVNDCDGQENLHMLCIILSSTLKASTTDKASKCHAHIQARRSHLADACVNVQRLAHVTHVANSCIKQASGYCGSSGQLSTLCQDMQQVFLCRRMLSTSTLSSAVSTFMHD